jgi:hypothetical protein
MTLTEHLRRYIVSGEPNVALLAALAELVRERIWKSDMWEQPPDYFGYPEYGSWGEAFSGDDPSPGPAADFFLEEVVQELPFLERTIQEGNSVEALLRQKVKWFLTDRQKKHDPVGYRTFTNLVAVLEGMIADGAATATNRVRSKLRNPTLIQLKLGDSGPTPAARDLARVVDTDPDWLPVLRRLAKLGKGAQRLLRERLDRFPSQGVVAFSVGELGAVLKARVREAHEAWNRPAGGSPATSRRTPEPSDDFRTDALPGRYSSFEECLGALRQGVPEAVERSDYTPKVRRGMLAVFADWLKYLAVGQDHPPLREWAAQLGLPKSSLGDYLQRLRSLIQEVLKIRGAE